MFGVNLAGTNIERYHFIMYKARTKLNLLSIVLFTWYLVFCYCFWVRTLPNSNKIWKRKKTEVNFHHDTVVGFLFKWRNTLHFLPPHIYAFFLVAPTLFKPIKTVEINVHNIYDQPATFCRKFVKKFFRPRSCNFLSSLTTLLTVV